VPSDEEIDGLFDDVEACITFSDPTLWDSDGGGTSDGDEVLMLTDPLDPADDIAPVDTDGDGLSDATEDWWFGTDPTTSDTDGDGVNDLDEIVAGTDPLVP
jgi:hypothetical protein